MEYSAIDQQVFYERQMRRIVKLVKRCDDAQSVTAVLQAAIYCMEKTEGRAWSGKGIEELNRSVLH